MQPSAWRFASDFLALSNDGTIARGEIMRVVRFQSATLLPFWDEMQFPWPISNLCSISNFLRDSQRGNFDIMN